MPAGSRTEENNARETDGQNGMKLRASHPDSPKSPTRIARLIYHVEEGNTPPFAQSPTMTRQRHLDFLSCRAYIIVSPEVAYHDAEYCLLMCDYLVFILQLLSLYIVIT